MTNEERPKHLDLFSGIGGFTVAAEAAGFQTIAFSEIDPYASAVLRKHWPTVRNLGDITKYIQWPRLNPDLITGGFPCQPFSVAGKRRGISDDRNLWPAMLGVIKVQRPALILGENVINIKNMVLDQCQDDLEAIGYQSQAFDISACACGLSTMERHIWIVAANREIMLQRISEKRLSKKPNVFEREQRADNAASKKVFKLPDLPASKFLGSSKGFPNFVDRCSCIGNSIPPQVAEVILKEMIKLL